MLISSDEIDIPESTQTRLMDVSLPEFPMPPYDCVAYEDLPGERAGEKLRLEIEFKQLPKVKPTRP